VKPIISLCLLLSVGGCGLVEGSACDDSVRPAIRLSVVDSLTGGPITAPELIAKASTSSYMDSVRVSSADAANEVQLAFEHAGTFTVDVTAAGYVAWRRTGIRVTEGDCHVRTASVVARLRRS
jgi:hypothetical protein